jgi:endonuclease G
MIRRNPDRLKRYLELITQRKGGIESVFQDIKSVAQARIAAPESAFESMAFEHEPLEAAQRGLEAMSLGREIDPDEEVGLEAIINAELRPAIDVINGTFASTHPLWAHLSSNAATKARIEAVLPSIGRIELLGHPNLPYGGTGFVVGDGLIMTNRHVAEIFAQGLGDRNLVFVNGNRAGIDFLREHDQPTGPTLMVRRIVMIHPYWDMAILAVEGMPHARRPLRLGLNDARDLTGREIVVVGYPAFDPRNPAVEQNDLFNGHYGIKRLQPGILQGGFNTSSFRKVVFAATHDCSTLGGNSGSAVIDLETGEVFALHFGGRYHDRNFGVPTAALARDGRVVDAGVQFAGTPLGGVDPVSADWWRRADAAEAAALVQAPYPQVTDDASPLVFPVGPALAAAAGSVTLEIPLRITVSLGHPDTAAAVAAEPLASTESIEEAVREPLHDTDYSSRTGYDPSFLNQPGQDPNWPVLVVPMPEAADQTMLARTRDGGTVLRYQNFSIAMHRERRLALQCASNVTDEPVLREPEPGKDYSRKGLGGLGKNDQERWFLDPRLDSAAQLPDVFFTKDRKSFDKGHLVRREDVAFGTSYNLIRRANGDTFHVTNCSPQVAGFNQSQAGQNNWGDLENHVMSEAANERLCLFAGPVLDPADEVFVGTGDGGKVLRAKIPKRFWKVICARVDTGLAAFGFVLEQELDAVDWEFTVPADYRPAMYPLVDIANMAGIVFDTSLLDADQYGTVRGDELALRSNARQRRKRSINGMKASEPFRD